jgi:hypothetical protein
MGAAYHIDLTLSDRNAAIVREHGLDVPEICARAILQEIQTRQAVEGLMNAVKSGP